MFQIDDEFLASIGYDVASLTSEQRQQYIDELQQEIGERVTARLVDELSDEQIEEFNDIQENPERTYRWLREFHADYADRSEYRSILEAEGDASSAAVMYATALWMNDAVPDYAGLAQQEFDNYHTELVDMRQAADRATAGDSSYGE